MNDERRLLLIDRAVVREADERDWDELLAFADRDDAILRELAESQRDQVRLECLMGRADDTGDRVRPTTAVRPRPDALRPRTLDRATDPSDGHPPIRRLGAWSGWAIAALIALAWVVGRVTPTPPLGAPSTPGVQSAGVPAASWGSSQEAFDAYLDKGRREGRVLSDAPRRVLIESRPVTSGEGFELIYVQQIVERTIVPDLYRYSSADERGIPAPVRVAPARALPVRHGAM